MKLFVRDVLGLELRDGQLLVGNKTTKSIVVCGRIKSVAQSALIVADSTGSIRVIGSTPVAEGAFVEVHGDLMVDRNGSRSIGATQIIPRTETSERLQELQVRFFYETTLLGNGPSAPPPRKPATTSDQIERDLSPSQQDDLAYSDDFAEFDVAALTQIAVAAEMHQNLPEAVVDEFALEEFIRSHPNGISLHGIHTNFPQASVPSLNALITSVYCIFNYQLNAQGLVYLMDDKWFPL